MMTVEHSANARPPPQALGINVDKPKFAQYAVYTKRLETFDNWPEHSPVGKERLVEAGLVYTGVGDSCRCYHCGGGLRNWEQGDNPMIEHAKWYPKCPHLLLVKGQRFIDKVTRGETIYEDDTQMDCGIVYDTKHIESVAALSCIQMGYLQDMVQKAIEVFIAQNRHCNFKGVDLCEILFDMEEHPENYNNCNVADSTIQSDLSSEDLESLREENERLKESNLCKVCVDNRADVIFLPCGHMVCCPQCAPAMFKCPICRKPINGQIKAFFATVKS